MGAFLVRRIVVSIIVLVGITGIAFLVLAAAPGDPTAALINPEQLLRMSPQELAEVRARLGLDAPVHIRYLRWIGLEAVFAPLSGVADPVNGILQGDFGYSIKSGRSIVQEIAPRIGPSLMLMSTALVIALVVGVPIGVASAVLQYSLLDYALTTLTFVIISIPRFVLGLVLIYALAVELRLLPTGGMFTIDREFDLAARLSHLVMPGAILGIVAAGQLMRYTRSGMLDVLSSDYLVTARAKGLTRSVVLIRHGLRNALIPIITVVALIVPDLVAGSIVIEQVFNWPGLGLLAVRAAADRDPSLMMGIVLIVGVTVLVCNLIADVTYGLVDPRVRLGADG